MQERYTHDHRLVKTLLEILSAFRPLFSQERTFQRACTLLFGLLFSFARKTLSQVRISLGLAQDDWTADYRLLSRARFPVEEASRTLFQLTLSAVPADQPYTVVIDVTHVPRSSLKMPGSAWGRAPRTAPWRRGLARMQRFLNLCWLVPEQQGYRRAIPLLFRHAPTPKAIPAHAQPCREWEAGQAALHWQREQLDQAGRHEQLLLAAADGSYDGNDFWKGLPPRTAVVVRCAKNRKLRMMPGQEAPHLRTMPSATEAGPRRGARRKYGAALPSPQHLRRERAYWTKFPLPIRGRSVVMKCRVVGPVLVEGAPQCPLFLILVKGYHRAHLGKRVCRQPCQYLVNAMPKCGPDGEPVGWTLPLPLEQLVAVTWHRWEIEVCHREMKTGFGLGQMQCWSYHGSILSVQFAAWAYAVLMLAGYKAWGGLIHASPSPTRWWKGGRRWSINTLLQSFRHELWELGDFQPVWMRIPNKGPINPQWMAGLSNAVAGSSRG